MFTTPNALTEAGQAAMQGVGAGFDRRVCATVSAHDACWERVPFKRVKELAAAALRIAIKAGHCRLTGPDPATAVKPHHEPAEVIYFRASA
jgi:hypothetical protein